jgi:hypothetical protein
MDGEGCKRGVEEACRHRTDQEELDSSERLLCLERHGGGWCGLKIFRPGRRYSRGHPKHDEDGGLVTFPCIQALPVFIKDEIMTSGMA